MINHVDWRLTDSLSSVFQCALARPNVDYHSSPLDAASNSFQPILLTNSTTRERLSIFTSLQLLKNFCRKTNFWMQKFFSNFATRRNTVMMECTKYWCWVVNLVGTKNWGEKLNRMLRDENGSCANTCMSWKHGYLNLTSITDVRRVTR